MDTKRLVLFVIFSFSTLMLWDAWQTQNAPQKPPVTSASTDAAIPSAASVESTDSAQTINEQYKLADAEKITVKTDLYQAEISTVGGDIRHLTLNKHLADGETEDAFVLMDDKADPMLYVAQSGLIPPKNAPYELPFHKTVFTAAQTHYQMDEGTDCLDVKLSWQNNGVSVDKIYTFYRDKYEVEVTYHINNTSGSEITPSVYYQITHDNESNQGSTFMPTFTGGAYFTKENNFNKVSFDDMADKDFKLKTKDGWVGLLQHYFVSAWIPKEGVPSEFYSKQLSDNIFAIGAVNPVGKIASGDAVDVKARLFAGPQKAEYLEAAAPGLENSVDYGWLAVIAKPLFWLLSKIHGFVGNWGIAIIIVTLIIKAAFFKLSDTSYRSMAQMREIAPRMQSMKEKYGDDKQKMQQAMMELYKNEKINPLSGCLPILVQIPVFIAFYWMLLGSVELRHAPFFGWIQDLSAKDPYYILPILMGATMIFQTFLNPPPADPMQAKIMKIMPVVFSIFFFFFPAGLVLYWLVNNVLSIAQQWYINKKIHADTLAKKGSGKR